MKKLVSKLILTGLLCLVIGSVFAATIIVPTNQPTLAAAIAAAVSGDTISVNAGTYVNDTISIVDKSLTIIGNGTRPVITLSSSPVVANVGTSDVSAGVMITKTTTLNLATMNITLQNLTFIPAKEDISATRANKGINVRTPGQTLGNGTSINLIMTDVLVCPNNGADAPVTTDGLSYANMAGAIAFRDDGILTRGNINATFTRVISSNQRPSGSAGASASADGFVLVNPSSGNYTTNFNACVISFCERIGVQASANGNIYNFVGTAAARNKFIGNGLINSGNGDIAVFGGAGIGGTTGNVKVDYCDFVSYSQAGFLTALNGNNGLPFIISNSRFFSAITIQRDCIQLADSAFGQATITNCSFFNRNSTTSGVNISGATNTTSLVITNSIFAGESGIGGNGVNNDATTAFAAVSFSDLDTTGTNALSKITTGAGSAQITLGTGVIYSDPQFQATNPIGNLDLSISPVFVGGQPGSSQTISGVGGKALNVTNTAFATAASGGTPLKGGAGYAPSGNYLVWSSSSTAIASLTASSGDTATFLFGPSTGNVTITATDVNGQVATVIASVSPTSAPLAVEGIKD